MGKVLKEKGKKPTENKAAAKSPAKTAESKPQATPTKRKIASVSSNTEQESPKKPKPVVQKAADDGDFPRGDRRPRSTTPGKQGATKPSQIIREGLFDVKATSSKKKVLKEARLNPKHRQKSKEKGKSAVVVKPPSTRVEILSRKNLKIGTTLLAVVNRICSLKVILSLPHGIPATLNIVDISDEISEALETQEGENGSKVTGEIPDLEKMFTLGDILIVSFLEQKEVKGSSRYLVSTKPSAVNKGLNFESISPGHNLVGSIKSKEDHGYVINLGIEGCTAFLNKKNLRENETLHLGQVLIFGVLSSHKTRKVISLTRDPKHISEMRAVVSNDFSIDSLKPGMLVDARLKQVKDNGVLMTVSDRFDGSVFYYHMKNPVANDYGEPFKSNSTVSARVLFIDPTTKTLGLTLKAEFLDFTAPKMENWGVGVGSVIENTKLAKQDKRHGWIVDLGEGRYGYAPANSLPKDQKEASKLVKGYVSRCKIVSFSAADGFAIVSLNPSVIDCPILHNSDLLAGQVVKGKVKKINPDNLEVSLTDKVTATCPILHCGEGLLRNLSQFSVGQEYSFKVWDTTAKGPACILTKKPSLMKSSLPIITSYDGAVPGTITHVVITSVSEKGCGVSFYNQISGFIPKDNLCVSANVDESFFTGQVVKALVTKCKKEKKKIYLSLDLEFKVGAKKATVKTLSVGKVYDFVVSKPKSAELSDGIYVTIAGELDGFIPYHHFSDFEENVESLKKYYTIGRSGSGLVYCLNKKQNLAYITLKPSIINAVNEGTIPSEYPDFEESKVYLGVISAVSQTGCFVQFLNNKAGSVPKKFLQDGFVTDPSVYFKAGMTTYAKVVSKNVEKGSLILSMKASECGLDFDRAWFANFFEEKSKVASLDPDVLSITSLPVGQIVDAEVVTTSETNLILKLSNGASAICPQFSFNSDHGKTGKKVKAMITDVDSIRGVFEVTLKPEYTEVQETQPQTKKGKKGAKKTVDVAPKPIEVDSVVDGQIITIKENYLIVYSPSHRAVIFSQLAPTNFRMNRTGLYQPNDNIQLQVTHVDFGENKRILAVPKEFKLPIAKEGSTTTQETKKIIAGEVLEGKIIAKVKSAYVVGFGRKLNGLLHFTDIFDDYTNKQRPSEEFQTGLVVKVKVTEVLKDEETASDNAESKETANKPLCHLSMKPSVLSKPGVPISSLTRSSLQLGQQVSGVIQSISAEFVDISITHGIMGRIMAVDLAENDSDLRTIKERDFKEGQYISAYIARLGGSNSKPLLSVQHQEKSEYTKDDVTICQVIKKLSAFHILVSLPNGCSGKVCLTDFSDEYKTDPFKDFSVGSLHRCYVIEFNAHNDVTVSLRNSRISGTTAVDREITTLADLTPGNTVRGYVCATRDKAVRIMIGRDIYAQVHDPSFLSKKSQELLKLYPIGTLMKIVLYRVNMEKNQVSGHIAGANKTEGAQSDKAFDDLKVGDLVNVRVKKIISCGLILEVENTLFSGLCHVSQVEKSLEEFNEGQKIKAVITKVKKEHQKISFSIKQSIVSVANKKDGDTNDEDEDENAENNDQMEEDDEDETIVRDVTDFDMGSTKKGRSTKVDDEDDEEEEEEQEEEEEENEEEDEDDDEEEDDDEDGDNEEEEDDDEDDNGDENAFAPGSFGWDDLKFSEQPTKKKSSKGGEKESDDDEDEDEDEDEESAKEKNSKSKKQKIKEKRQEEEKIKRMEDALLDEDRAPQSVADFERLLLGNPNSSFIWVQYMAFQISLTEIEQAREIAERALKTISFKDENEKLNVWTAFLNLENTYGTEESMMKVFQRALTHNDAKKVYLRMVDILESSKKNKLAEQVFKSLISKYKHSKKVWVRYGQFKLANNLIDEFRKVQERAIQMLPRRKHIQTIVKFAMMEFKNGSSDRGRIIFDSVLGNFPKRVDLWSVYLDMEIKTGNEEIIRTLFERVTSLSLSSKKMKFFFKRYLEWEKETGDEERIEHVKEKARLYVESKMTK